MRLEAHKLAVELPHGWEGRIRTSPEAAGGPDEALRGGSARRPPATLHAASFPLPPRDGDFGSSATARMSATDAFLALTEYLEGNGLRAGEGLFRSSQLRRALQPAMFSPHTLLVARPGQAGFQHFFTAAGRPFCLYVVIGSPRLPETSLRQIDRVLGSLRIRPGR